MTVEMSVRPIFATNVTELAPTFADHVYTPLSLAHRSLAPLTVLIPLSNFEKNRLIVPAISLMNRKNTFGAKGVATVIAGQDILVYLPENSIAVVVRAYLQVLSHGFLHHLLHSFEVSLYIYRQLLEKISLHI